MSNRIIKISNKEKFSENSENFQIEPSKQYGAVTKVRGNKGKPYSAYFVIVVLNENNFEISRFIRWINNFSGSETVYLLKFTAPNESKFAVIGYRCNQETPLKSDLEIEIPDKNELDLLSFDESDNEVYDDLNDFTVTSFSSLIKDEEKILEKNMVWVLGSTRSGSTWLCMNLLNHRKTIYWNEPDIAHHFDSIRDWSNMKSHRDRADYFFALRHKNNFWLPVFRKLILARTYLKAKTLSKKIIIKEPESYAADLLMEFLPSSRMIFLLRDGRDVVDSWIDSHRPDSWEPSRKPLITPKMRLDKIEEYSDNWNKLTNVVWDAYQNHESNLRLLVKYEDLLKDTLLQLKKIYDFIGIKTTESELKEKIKKYDFKNIPSSMKGTGKFYRVATPGKWKDNFNQEEKNLMNSIMGKTLKKMNY